MPYIYYLISKDPSVPPKEVENLEAVESRMVNANSWQQMHVHVASVSARGDILPTVNIYDDDGLGDWRRGLEQVAAWKEPKKPTPIFDDSVNPPHYKSYFGGNDNREALQWLEAMQYVREFREPEKFIAAVELQYRKYLDRLGGKDAEVKELLKAVWYIRFVAAYIANNRKPIRVADIPRLLGEVPI